MHTILLPISRNCVPTLATTVGPYRSGTLDLSRGISIEHFCDLCNSLFARQRRLSKSLISLLLGGPSRHSSGITLRITIWKWQSGGPGAMKKVKSRNLLQPKRAEYLLFSRFDWGWIFCCDCSLPLRRTSPKKSGLGRIRTTPPYICVEDGPWSKNWKESAMDTRSINQRARQPYLHSIMRWLQWWRWGRRKTKNAHPSRPRRKSKR